MHPYPGRFIVIEGVDYCGKTTQARRLVSRLKRRNYAVEHIREPGGTDVSEKIRRILLSRRNQMCARTELFLYLSARAEVTAQKIRPALEDGKIVVADRYHLSTYAYQIGGRGIDETVVKSADEFARHTIEPDLTIVLDITPAEAKRRMLTAGKTPDRMEDEKAAFVRRIRKYYQTAAEEMANVALIPGRRPPEAIADHIDELIAPLLS